MTGPFLKIRNFRKIANSDITNSKTRVTLRTGAGNLAKQLHKLIGHKQKPTICMSQIITYDSFIDSFKDVTWRMSSEEDFRGHFRSLYHFRFV